MSNEIKIVLRGNIKEVRKSARAMIAPPKHIPSYKEVAAKIKFPDGPLAGHIYNPEDDPVHAAITQELPKWTRHVWPGAVQTGKSLLESLVIFRTAMFERRSVVYSQPTMPKIHEAWAGKLVPVIDSSEFSGWMPQKGQGSKGSQTPAFLLFRDPATKVRAGMLYFLAGGGKSEAAQAGTTAPVIVVDEVDSFKDRHRIELVGKRADSFGRKAKRIYTSTVKMDKDSIILGLYADSTQSRLWFKCPACGKWQPAEWEQVKYDGTDEVTAIQSAVYRCMHCPEEMDEDKRQHMLKEWRVVHAGQIVDSAGTVVGDTPRVETFGLLWTALDSSLRSLSVLALEHFRAQKAVEQGEHGPMRSFYRDQLCRMYTGELEELEAAGPLTWQFLAQRSMREKWGPARHVTDRDPADPEKYLFSRRVAPIPQEAGWSVGGVDVQHNRVYWKLRAFALDETSWVYAWGYEYARPDHEAADKREMHQLLNRVYSTLKQYCGHTSLVLCGLDVSDNTDSLREWVDEVGRPWVAMKGTTNTMKMEPGDVEGLVYVRDRLYHHNVESGRDLVHTALRRPFDAPGAMRYPYGLGMQDVSVFRHLVSIQTTIDPETKKRVLLYGTGRDDWLDCAKMTQCLMVGAINDMKLEQGRVREMQKPIDPPVVAHHDDQTPVRVNSTLQVSREANPRESFYRTTRRYGFARRGF